MSSGLIEAAHGPDELRALAEVARIATDDLELRPTLQRIADSLTALFGWELVALIRVDRAANRFVCEALATALPTAIHVGYSRELGSGVVGRVARDGQPIVVDDADLFDGFVQTLPEGRAEICVPVRHRGEIVAILNAESLTVGAFRNSLPLLEAIAGQVAGAIASARLFEATRWRAQAAEIEAEVTRLATSGGDLDARLERLVVYLRETFDLALVGLALADSTGSVWHQQAVAVGPGAPPLPPLQSWSTERGLIGRAMRERQSQLALDVRSDPDYFAVLPDVVAELVVPLVVEGRAVGALNWEATSVAALGPEQVVFFESIANRVAGAIELAVTNRELERSRLELAAAAERLEQANLELERLTLVDGLTGVANRRCFDHQLDAEWRRAVRAQTPIALAFVDVDCFKAFNDTRGHLEGDECLRCVAAILARGVQRAGDLVARWGGEEFAVLLPGATADTARLLVERLRRDISEAGMHHPSSSVGAHVTVSIGLAVVVPSAEVSPSDLVAAADAALYRAKRAGRDQVVVAA